MTILWMNLGVAYFFSLMSRYFSRPYLNNIDFVRPNRMLLVTTITIIVLVSGLRINIGDTTAYMNSYESTTLTWETVSEGKDIGFNIFQLVLKSFSNDPQIFIFTVSLITNVLIIFGLYKYSRLFELGVYVYLTGGLFISGMNGIRQFLAAAIVFSATKYLFTGSWKKYFLIILVAAQIHNTAYILLPIYFIVRKKAWSKLTLCLLIVGVGIVIGFNEFSSILFAALEDTQYAAYSSAGYGGANYIRVFVYSIPLLVAYFGREKFRVICPFNDYIVNMSILGFVFMLISTQDWIFARFAYYFGLYNILLVSWIPKLAKSKGQKVIYGGILFCYFCYFYYENVISMGLVYKSNFLFL